MFCFIPKDDNTVRNELKKHFIFYRPVKKIKKLKQKKKKIIFSWRDLTVQLLQKNNILTNISESIYLSKYPVYNDDELQNLLDQGFTMEDTHK